MSSLVNDLRTAARQARRSPLFTISVVVSLGLALTANIVIFSLVNQVLLRPLGGMDGERLVRVGATERGAGPLVVSYDELLDIRESVPAFESVVAHRFNQVAASIDSDPRDLGVEIVSANYFDALGARLALGRGFLADERPPAQPRVAVVSDRVWRTRLDADPSAVGRTIRISGQSYTVVGVAAPDLLGTFPGFAIDLWVPLAMHDRVLPGLGSIGNRQDQMFNLTARLSAVATESQAIAQLEVLAARLAENHPTLNANRGFAIAPATGVHPMIAGVARVFLLLLSGIVALLLLAACANVTNLVLARATSRRVEIGTRLALGASRARVIALLLTESLALGLAASGLGLLLAAWANRAISNLALPIGVPLALDLRLEVSVIAYALLLGTGAGAAIGLLPALRASRGDILPALRGSTAVAGGQRSRLRNGLIVAQVAVCCALLVGATLLTRTISASSRFDVGFEPAGVVVAQGDPGALGLTEAQARVAWQQLRDQVGALPEVESVATALFTPLAGRADSMMVRDAAQDVATGRMTQYNLVDPGYLDLIQIPLLSGRGVLESDTKGNAQIAVINAQLATRLWPDRSAVGQTLVVVDREGVDRLVEVVGVAADSVYRRMGEDPMPFVFLPEAQWYRSDRVLFARQRPGADAIVSIRDLASASAPDVPFEIQPLSSAMQFSLIIPRVLGAVLGFAAIIALLLAATGLFGVIAYVTEQRRQEFGIRMALGADAPRILRSVLGGGVKVTLAGLALGLALAAGMGRLLAGFLYGVSAADPATFAGVTVFLLGVAIAAAWLPARRATATDPVAALRQD